MLLCLNIRRSLLRVHPGVALLCLCALSACASHDLPEARNAFYQGNYQQAEKAIGAGVVEGTDSVLVLMERGTILQAKGEYAKSSINFIRANDLLKTLETYSLSEGAGSWVANDTVYSYEGPAFEQTLLHSMTALNHLALGNWEDGGVEARRILLSLKEEQRGQEYPDDAFSRYLTAFILEMNDDDSNARMQFQLANTLLADIEIDEQGRIRQNNSREQTAAEMEQHELVCFFLIGRSPTMREVRKEGDSSFLSPQIKLFAGGKLLGNATILTNVYSLARITWNLDAPTRIAKMAARIAAKEAIAVAIEKKDAALGALTRIILIGMLEDPDLRRWETLPHWLAVAKVPCPANLTSFDVTIQGGENITGYTLTVQQPVVRRGNVYFSFVRDLPGFNSIKIKKEIDKGR